MKVMTMLDLDTVDLADIAEALEDNSYEHRWYLDPQTGSVEFRSEYTEEEPDEDPDELGWIGIRSLGSGEGYRDMEDFIDQVRDPRASDLLARAIEGRGAFRRFKDTLLDFPELRRAWFTFHDVRMERRAIEWLLDEELVDEVQARAALDRLADPESPELAGPFDADAVAAEIAADLRTLYGRRLRHVLLFGSWARGDADAESDLDLLVVLDRLDSPFAEIDRMNDVLWSHTMAHGIAVSVVPVAVAELQEQSTAFLQRVQAEGRAVA
jgi:predicted nucleotidyltransferase